MKIAIVGDPHYGASYNFGKIDPETQLNFRLLDYVNTFNNLVEEFEKRNVELMVITGDIFETRHPTSAQLNAFSKCINNAISRGIQVVIVAGNHDQQRTIATTTVDIFNHLNIPGVSVYTGFDIHDFNGFKLALLSYKDRRMTREKTTEEAIKNIQSQISKLSTQVSDPKIVIGHFMIGKPVAGTNPDSFSINELILPLASFSGFDAVIMGHVHKHMILSHNPFMAYVGSMERNSFGEKDHNKVSFVLDTDNMKKVEIIPNKVRSLLEIALDYTDDNKEYGQKIMDKMLLDINKFDMRYGMEDSIIKFMAKVSKDDMYYISQEMAKNQILNKKVKSIFSIEIKADSSRQLRNKKINEDTSGKKAITSYIRQLIEPENIKNKLIKCAHSIIEEVEGK